MKAGWRVARLGDLCRKITDGSHNPPKGIELSSYLMLSSKNIFDDKILLDEPRYLSESDFQKENKRTNIECGDVLLTIVGTIGRVAVVHQNLPSFTLQRSVAVLKPKLNLLQARFLMRALQNKLDILDKNARGVAQKGLYLGQLQNLEIEFPNVPEQQRIVAILDEAFAGIEKSRANAEQNLANARALFDGYLNEVFKRNADGWIEKRLVEVCLIKPQKSEAKKRLADSDMVSFVPMENLGIGQKEFFVTQARRLDEVAGSYTYFADEDVLLAKITPCFENGKLGIARNLKNGVGFGSSEYIVFRVSEDLNNEYLYYFLDRQSFRDEGASRMTGAVGHKRVPLDFIQNYPILLPPILEQQRIVTILDELSIETKKLESIYQQKINALDELKKSILHKAFTGEL